MIWTQHQNTLGVNSAPSTGSTPLYLGNFMVSVPLSRTPRLLPASLQACETWSSEDTSNNLNFCSTSSLFPPSQIYWSQFSSHNPNDILPIQHRALLSKQCYHHFYYSLPTPLRLSHDSTHAFFTSTDSIRSFLDRMYGIKGSSHSSPAHLSISGLHSPTSPVICFIFSHYLLISLTLAGSRCNQFFLFSFTLLND